MTETTGVYFLTVPEARSPDQAVSRVVFSLGLFFSLVCILIFSCREAGHIGLGSTHLTSFYLPFPFKGLISKQNTSSHSTYCGVVVESLKSCLALGDPMDCRPLACSWDFPGKNTGVRCHFLLQGIFPTQD